MKAWAEVSPTITEAAVNFIVLLVRDKESGEKRAAEERYQAESAAVILAFNRNPGTSNRPGPAGQSMNSGTWPQYCGPPGHGCVLRWLFGRCVLRGP